MQNELSREEALLLEELTKHKVRYLLVGLSAAALQGAHVVTQDIDLWVEDLSAPSFQSAVRDAGGFFIPAGVAGMNPPMLGPQHLRVFDLVTQLHGLSDFDSEYRNATDFQIKDIAVRVLPLERIIASKRAADREKDRVVLPVLEAALAILRGGKK